MDTRGLFHHCLFMHAVQRTATLTGVTYCRIQTTDVTGTARKTAPFTGSFTRTNGTTGTSGTPELSGSLLLASNNFYRAFTDNPAITTAAAALPQVQGSGWVRDLREAMSLGSAHSLR
jgi:hypothetical protein